MSVVLRPRFLGERSPTVRGRRLRPTPRAVCSDRLRAGDLLARGREADALVSGDLAVAVAEHLSHQEPARAFRDLGYEAEAGVLLRKLVRARARFVRTSGSADRSRGGLRARRGLVGPRGARPRGWRSSSAIRARVAMAAPRWTDVWVSSCSQANEQASSIVCGSARACRATRRSSRRASSRCIAAIRWKRVVVACASWAWVAMGPRKRSCCREAVAARNDERPARDIADGPLGSRCVAGRSLGRGRSRLDAGPAQLLAAQDVNRGRSLRRGRWSSPSSAPSSDAARPRADLSSSPTLEL